MSSSKLWFLLSNDAIYQKKKTYFLVWSINKTIQFKKNEEF